MTQPSSQPGRRRWAGLTASLLGLAVLGATAPAGAQPITPTGARGFWLDTDPLTITSVDPLGAGTLVTATGASTWTGTFSGTTRFVVHALFHPAGSATGKIDETFDGTVAGAATEVRFAETFYQDPDGSIRITAVSDPAQPLAAVLRFTGATDATGVGGGTYTGTVATT